MLRSSSFLALAMLAAALPRAVRADAPPSSPLPVERALAEAFDAMGAGDLSGAHERCARLHAVQPGGDSLHCLGAVALARRDYPEAIRLLRRALSDVTRPMTETARGDAEDRLTRAERAVALLRIDASPKPAVVLVDGAPVALRDDALVLVPGTHRITLRAPHHLPVEQRVTVAAGDRTSLHFALPPAPVDAPLTQPVASSGRTPIYKSAWLWGGVGTFVAAAAVGLALGLRRDTVTDRPIADAPFATAKGP